MSTKRPSEIFESGPLCTACMKYHVVTKGRAKCFKCYHPVLHLSDKGLCKYCSSMSANSTDTGWKCSNCNRPTSIL